MSIQIPDEILARFNMKDPKTVVRIPLVQNPISDTVLDAYLGFEDLGTVPFLEVEKDFLGDDLREDWVDDGYSDHPRIWMRKLKELGWDVEPAVIHSSELSDMDWTLSPRTTIIGPSTSNGIYELPPGSYEPDFAYSFEPNGHVNVRAFNQGKNAVNMDQWILALYVGYHKEGIDPDNGLLMAAAKKVPITQGLEVFMMGSSVDDNPHVYAMRMCPDGVVDFCGLFEDVSFLPQRNTIYVPEAEKRYWIGASGQMADRLGEAHGKPISIKEHRN